MYLLESVANISSQEVGPMRKGCHPLLGSNIVLHAKNVLLQDRVSPLPLLTLRDAHAPAITGPNHPAERWTNKVLEQQDELLELLGSRFLL